MQLLQEATHEAFMNRALVLASLGKYTTAPNPMVGAVLVYNGKVIGEGYHQAFGGPHAEVSCIQSVREEDIKLIPEATLYVTLEPCSHYGKTPPCAHLILEKGIKSVVVGMQDPNPQVSGRGVSLLKENGVQVAYSSFQNECACLNRKFIVNQTEQRPYITLKWAETEDGYIGSGSEERWIISNAVTQRMVHKLRAAHSAVAIGTSTALADNPLLDTRFFPYATPRKIICYHSTDRIERLKNQYKEEDNWTLVPLRDNWLSSSFQQELLASGISSILVEGGAQVLDFFIKNNCWDEAIVIKANGVTFPTNAQSVKAPSIHGAVVNTSFLANDKIINYKKGK